MVETNTAHHVVAGVDALGAVDALHLQALADVDAGRTGADAEIAVDAIPRGAFLFLAPPPSRLTATRVVADDQRLAVEEDRLEAAIGAGDDARLLAEVGKVKEHQERRTEHQGKGGRVPGGRARHPAKELIPTNEISKEGVREEGGDDEKDDVLDQPAGIGGCGRPR